MSLPLRKNVYVFQDAYLKPKRRKRRRTIGKRRDRNAAGTLDETADGISGTFTHRVNQTEKKRKASPFLRYTNNTKCVCCCFRNVHTHTWTHYEYTPQSLFMPQSLTWPAACCTTITNKSCQQGLWLSPILFKTCACWLNPEYFSVYIVIFYFTKYQSLASLSVNKPHQNRQKHNPTFTHKTIQKGQCTVVRGRSWDINQSMAGKQSRAFPPHWMLTFQ